MKKTMIILLAVSLSAGLSAGVTHRVGEPQCVVEKQSLTQVIDFTSQSIEFTSYDVVMPELAVVIDAIQLPSAITPAATSFAPAEVNGNELILWRDPGRSILKSTPYLYSASIKGRSAHKWLDSIRQC